MPHGEISKLSDSHFVWTIYDLYNLSLNWKILRSSEFQYMNISYYLQTVVTASMIENSSSNSYNIVCRICTFALNFATYTIRILDIDGHELGTLNSKVSGEFNIVKVGSWISSEHVVQFHVTFDAPPTRQECVFAVGNFFCLTTDVGTQTCLDLKPESSSSCSSEGVDNILKNFERLLLSGHASDVTFNVKGTEIKAFLTAQSEVFDKMLNNEMLEKTSGIVEITDSEPVDFHALLFYTYTGRVEMLTVERAAELYCLANKYKIDVLGPYCIQFLISNLSVESFCDVLSLGLRHSETDLLDSANSYLHENMKQIVCSPKWMAFNNKNPDGATKILMKAIF